MNFTPTLHQSFVYNTYVVYSFRVGLGLQRFNNVPKVQF